MKRTPFKIVIAFIALISLMYGCRETEKTVDKQKDTSATDTSTIINQRPINYDSLLTQLLALQNELLQNPDDTHCIKLILNTSFDSLENRFYCAGKGVVNKSQPAGAQEIGMRLAAQRTAQRWALYLKTWQENTMTPFGVEISGSLTSGTTVLFEKTSGDTLYQLLSVSSEQVKIL